MPVAAQLEGWLHSRAMAQLAGQRFPPLRRGAHTRKKLESTGSRQARDGWPCVAPLYFGQGHPGELEAGDQAPMQQDVPPEERSLTDVHLLLVSPKFTFFSLLAKALQPPVLFSDP